MIARGGFNEKDFLNPLRINDARPKTRGGSAPRLGENTVEILTELGLSRER